MKLKIVKQIFRRGRTKSLFYAKDNSSYNNYNIGEYTYGDPRVLSWSDDEQLVIGKYCSIAEGVVILLGGEHRYDWVTTYPFSVLHSWARHISGHPSTKGPVLIGNDVWIGRDATILSGVKIGNGAVLATRSVVARDVPAYSIVAGNPAKVVKMRFDDDVISLLQEISWWDWEIERIEENIDLLMSPPSIEKLRSFLPK